MGETAVPAPGKGREGRYVQRKGLGKATDLTMGLFGWRKRQFSRRGRDGQAGPSRERAQESPRTDCGPVSMGETEVLVPGKGRAGRNVQSKDLFGWGKRRLLCRGRDGQAGQPRKRPRKAHGLIAGLFEWGERQFSRRGRSQRRRTGRPVRPEEWPRKGPRNDRGPFLEAGGV